MKAISTVSTVLLALLSTLSPATWVSAQQSKVQKAVEVATDVARQLDAEADLRQSDIALSILHVSANSPAPTRLFTPAGQPDSGATTPSCAGGIVYDDGSFEGWVEAFKTQTQNAVVMRFDPPVGSATLDQVCLCWRQGQFEGDTRIDHDIVVFDDDGPNGAPGTEWYRRSTFSEGIPDTPTVYSYDLSGLGVSLPPGSFYLGVGGWNGAVEDIGLCVDDDGPGAQPHYVSEDDGASWIFFPPGFFNSFGIRADVSGSAPVGCVGGQTELCIRNRFAVTMHWETTQGAGASGMANAVPLESLGIDQGGAFYFTNPTNPEVLIKVLNACTQGNPRYWVFYAATTNLEFDITVEDVVAGQTKVYHNPDRNPAPPVLDTNAFSTCP